MRRMESFLIMHYLLRRCAEIDIDTSCGDLFLTDFLSDTDPTLWADGRPMDQAIFDDWVEQTNIPHLNQKNIITANKKIHSYYQERGFNIARTK